MVLSFGTTIDVGPGCYLKIIFPDNTFKLDRFKGVYLNSNLFGGYKDESTTAEAVNNSPEDSF
jgi:hypothetical protein